MNKSVFVLGALLILQSISINVSGQDIWTYDRCVKQAMKNNVSIKQENFALDRALNDLTASRVNRIPDLNGFVNTSVNNGRSLDPITYQYNTQKFLYNTYSLQSSIKLFEGGKQNYIIAKYNLASDIQKLKVENRMLNVSKDVLVIFSEAIMHYEIASIWQVKLNGLEQQKVRAQALVESGRRTQTFVWELEIEIGRTKQYLDDVNYRIEVALLKLKSMVGLPLDSEMNIDKSPVQLSLDTLSYNNQQLEKIVLNTPAYKESVTQVAYAKRDLQLARSLQYPSISLGGVLGTGYSSKISNAGYLNGTSFSTQISNNVYQTVTLNVALPIISRFQTHYNIKRFKINELQSNEAQRQKTQEIRELLYIQNSQLKYSALRYQEIKKSVDNYNSILEEANLNFQSGRIDTFEYLHKQQEKYSLEQSLIELKYNHLISKKTIELFANGEVEF